MSIRVLVCCDGAAAAGLRDLLGRRGLLVTAVSAVRDALGVARAVAPDAVVVATSALGTDPGGELAALSALSKVVLLVAPGDAALRAGALRSGVRAGVHAVVPARSAGDCLARVIRTVVALDVVVLPAGALHELRPHRGHLPPGPLAARALDSLTRREGQVMLLLAQGRSNAEIASRLSIGTATVRSHVHRLLRKLAVPSRAGAVAVAYDSGLVAALERHRAGRPPRGRPADPAD